MIRRLLTRRRPERGAAAVETALVLSFLVTLSLGIGETAFMVINQLAVGNATREGARAGASVGTDPSADAVIVDIVEQALCSMVSGQATKVIIFRPNADGSVPGHVSNDSDYSTVTPSLANTFTPAGTRTCANGRVVPNFVQSGGSWDPTSRDDLLPDLDEIGILVLYDHDDMTGVLPMFDQDDLAEITIMRLEPEITF